MELNNGPLYVYGIFETRIFLLQIQDSLSELSLKTTEASRALNGIVEELNTTGGTLINRVSTTAKQSLDNSRQLFGGTSITLLLIAAFVLWWFIKRNVVRRLLSLQSATRSITRGNLDTEIIVEGHDELTDMATALQGFKNNAIHNRKLDEELRQHKTHLEELVEQRSEQLRATNQILSKEVQNHAIAREKAEQASQAKTAFLATMSHELRTPLSGALGTLRLLSETSLEARQKEQLQIIQAANTSLLDIVNDILGYSQIEAGKLNIDERRFELGELLNNVVGLMSVSINEKGNRLQLKTTLDKPLWLIGDSGKLHQVLINLIGNANKFTHQGLINVHVKTAPDTSSERKRLTFSVTDNGIGIAKDKQAEIFHAFTQVDASTSRQFGGIGLGLAICERLVEAMGGNIHLESAPGKGTSVTFDVSIHSANPVVIANTGQFENQLDLPSLGVLMVEDDATNSMVTEQYLTRLGHRVVCANSGEEALRLIDDDQLANTLSLVFARYQFTPALTDSAYSRIYASIVVLHCRKFLS